MEYQQIANGFIKISLFNIKCRIKYNQVEKTGLLHTI